MLEWFTSRFTIGEISGSLGDLGTLIPITLGMGKLGLINIGTTFFWGGLFNIIGGIFWDKPIPVQPMKTIGSSALSGSLTTPGSVSVAGFLTGTVVSVAGYFKVIQKIADIIPGVLIGIIQAGTGLRFSLSGVNMLKALKEWLGYDGYLLSIISALIVCLNFSNYKYSKYIPSALILFVIGLVISSVQTSMTSYKFFNPFFITYMSAEDWKNGFIKGAIPQIPLTILNSVIGIVDLSNSLFENNKMSIKEASLSLGFINILGCPFGAMPSCHGAGGLSGQYKFGARNGLSVIIIGTLKIVISLLFGNILLDLISNFPSSILGIMLLICGADLTVQGLKRVKSTHTIFVLGLSIALVFELWIAFLAGVILYVLKFDKDEEQSQDNNNNVSIECC
jgi:hypothetical protein